MGAQHWSAFTLQTRPLQHCPEPLQKSPASPHVGWQMPESQLPEQHSENVVQADPLGVQLLQIPRWQVSPGQQPLPHAAPSPGHAAQIPFVHLWLQQSR